MKQLKSVAILRGIIIAFLAMAVLSCEKISTKKFDCESIFIEKNNYYTCTTSYIHSYNTVRTRTISESTSNMFKARCLDDIDGITGYGSILVFSYEVKIKKNGTQEPTIEKYELSDFKEIDDVFCTFKLHYSNGYCDVSFKSDRYPMHIIAELKNWENPIYGNWSELERKQGVQRSIYSIISVLSVVEDAAAQQLAPSKTDLPPPAKDPITSVDKSAP